MEELVYLNGRLIPSSEAKLSPFDYGFLLGYGLFETMRAYSGHIFRLEQHLERLLRSAQLLELKLQLDASALRKALYETLEANNLKDARLRLTVSGGVGEVVPDLSSCKSATVFIVSRRYTPYTAQVYQEGFKAVMSDIRRNSRSPAAKTKSLNYLDNLLARSEARRAGCDEAILLDEQGFLAEGSTSNIFLVCGGMLLTPGEDSGILPGVTRQVVLELAPTLGIKAAVRKIAPEELALADEAFLTNSIMEIMPLTRVGEQKIGSGKAGEVAQRLMRAYTELVRRSAG